MKAIALIVVLFGLTTASESDAGAMMGIPDTMGLQATDPALHGGVSRSQPKQTLSPKAHALLELREEGLKIQAADGGQLTPEHRQYLQNKLDVIQAGNY